MRLNHKRMEAFRAVRERVQEMNDRAKGRQDPDPKREEDQCPTGKP
jgi:hypothetical protein